MVHNLVREAGVEGVVHVAGTEEAVRHEDGGVSSQNHPDAVEVLVDNRSDGGADRVVVVEGVDSHGGGGDASAVVPPSQSMGPVVESS